MKSVLVRAIRAAPLTVAYLAVLSATTVLVTSNAVDGERLLLALSTNLHELARVPARVLVGSAFLTSGWLELAIWFVLFAAVVAPVERALGSRRVLAVLAAGHVGATLLVAAGLALALHLGVVAPTVVDAEDVGASYAFFAIAGFAAYLLRPSARVSYLGLLAGFLCLGVVRSHTFTDFGHLTALAIGLACRPLATNVNRTDGRRDDAAVSQGTRRRWDEVPDAREAVRDRRRLLDRERGGGPSVQGGREGVTAS